MYTATGSRVTVAIGVMAICLAAISPTGTWAAEPVKQEKKAKKPATDVHRRAPTSAPKATASQNLPRQKLQEKPSPVSVKHPSSTSSLPTKEKPETKSPSPEPTSAQQPVYVGYPSALVIQLSFNRPTTASRRPCQAAGKKGLVLLTVTTASGENSKPFLVK